MKVKLRNTVGNYQRPDKLWEVYHPGDIFEVPQSEFYPDIMTKIKSAKKEEPIETATSTTEAEEPVVTVTAEEPKRRRRKT